MRTDGTAATGTTCEDVKRWLVAAFLTLPTTPIYSARPGEVDLLDPNVAPATFDWLRFSAEILGRGSRPRLILLTWARVEARRIAIRRNLPNPPGGGTVADFCAEFDIDRSTFDRTVTRVCRLLADAWNARCSVER